MTFGYIVLIFVSQIPLFLDRQGVSCIVLLEEGIPGISLVLEYIADGVPSRVGIPSFVISPAMSAVLCPDRYRAKIIRMIFASDSSISSVPFRRR